MRRVIQKSKVCFLWAILLTAGLMASPQVWAAGPIKVSVAVNGEDGIAEKPLGRVIRITRQPMPFVVILENVSEEPVKVWHAEAGLDTAVALEITDENNRTVTVRNKAQEGASSPDIYSLLAPGNPMRVSMRIDPDEWEGVPVMEEGKIKRFKVRAIYTNGSDEIYSDDYDVVAGRE